MARRDSVGEVPPVPWRTVVGSGIAGEAKLDHLRLVSLGMRCWQDIEHYGLRIWFTDPDTGSTLHLSRSWPRSEQENSPAATRRLVFRLAHWRVGKLFHKQQNAVPMASCC